MLKKTLDDRIMDFSIIKSAIDKVKTEDDDKNAKKGHKIKNIGGYGTISKFYRIIPTTSYIDYAKLFSYLGKFKSQSAYENFDTPTDTISNLRDGSDKFSLIELETAEKGARYVKYFMPKNTDINVVSLVPLAGMSSAEWEKFKLWMLLDPVMYRLKTSTS